MLPSPVEFLLALPWVLLFVLAPVLIRRRPWLHDHRPATKDLPLVSIIVPARNEADNIAGLTATLLCTRYARYEVILVDDRSTDGTAEIAKRLEANHPDVIRVLAGEPLPAGWVGKCWACWQGYRAAKGDVLVFTDADTRHHENLLGHALGALRDTGVDLLSVFPRQLTFTFWERLIQPHIFTAIMMRFRDGEQVNRTRNPRNVIANGQFIAFTREGYEAIGGHEAVRTEVTEDLRLAQQTVAAGRRMYMAWADDLIATRMYRSLHGIIEGWSKNLATGSRQSVDPWLRPVLPWLVSLFLLTFWVWPPLTLIATLVTSNASWGWSITATLASLGFWILMYRQYRIPIALAPLYPLGALMTTALFVRSTIQGNTVKWRGREYVLGAGSTGE
jgi:chlorobactene glucosyltransferase